MNTRPLLGFALVVGLVASAVAATVAPAALRAVQPAEIDAIFAASNRPGTPGAALAVIHEGKIIFERGYGCAELVQNTPITPETVFYIGSVSKQFTAAAIALLAHRGALSLDDDVRRHVPELPDYGSRITVRQLVHHTSGLRDYLALRDIAGEPGDGTFGDREMLALLQRQKNLNFPPGTRYLYSNSGYFLLSMIVRRVSGRSLREFAAAEFFGPLGMKTAVFRDDHTMSIARRADGHAPAATGGGGFRVSNPNFDVVGAGGVFMTVRDFLAWDRNFYDGKVGGKELVASLQVPAQLNDGTRIDYAFGLMTGSHRGLALIEHSGAYGGFRAHAIRFPAQQFSVVCFTNLATAAPGRLVREVAELYLAPQLEPPVAVAAKAGKSPKQAATAARTAPDSPVANAPAFAGTYRSEELAVDCHVTVAEGRLTLLRAGRTLGALQPVTGRTDTFVAGTWTLTFRRDPAGAVAGFTLDAGRASGLDFARR